MYLGTPETLATLPIRMAVKTHVPFILKNNSRHVLLLLGILRGFL